MQLAVERGLNGMVVMAVIALAMTCVAIPVQYVPVALACIAIAALLGVWTVRGDLLLLVCLWFVTVVCLDEEFWREDIPFFFNVTISRLLIVGMAMVSCGMWAMGRIRFRSSGAVMPLMLTILVVFTLSAVSSGFKTQSVASVHYRLIGGYWFAFALFFLVLHGVRREIHLRMLLMFFFAVSVYLTFTAWCEYFEVWSLVFPPYIADATKGIHFGRVRGPFLVSPMMGLALVFCFFNNLVLARHVSLLPRWIIRLVCALMLPAIFWTQTRSVWLGMIFALLVWMGYSRRRWSRTAAICTLTAVAMVVATANLDNIMSRNRTKGGITDPEPLKMRIGLALLTWDIFTDHPTTGVGFGHFRDEAPKYARQIGDEYYSFASSAMEHNNFLSLLAETGAVGLGLYLLLLFFLLRGSIRLYRRLPDGGLVGRDMVVLYWALFVVYMVDGMFRETSVHPFANSLFFGISGMVVALDWLRQREPAAAVTVEDTEAWRAEPAPEQA